MSLKSRRHSLVVILILTWTILTILLLCNVMFHFWAKVFTEVSLQPTLQHRFYHVPRALQTLASYAPALPFV